MPVEEFDAINVQANDHDFFVEIIDTGPGIPEDQQSRIFEALTPRRAGSGL
jgi:signal transduction histidine kinase